MTPRRRRGGAAILLVLVLPLLSGCGIGPQANPVVVASGRTGPAAAPSPSSTEVPLTVQVFLLHGDRLTRVPRTVPAGTGLTPSLTGLNLPLTPAEVSAGLRTALPTTQTIPAGRILGTVATITMPDGFDKLSVREQVNAMSQIVYTVTADTVATEVELVRNGQVMAVPVDGQRLVTGPVGRSDYAAEAPAAG